VQGASDEANGKARELSAVVQVRFHAAAPLGAKSNALDCRNRTICMNAGSNRVIGGLGSSTIGRLW
jgi:hypothetical protein